MKYLLLTALISFGANSEVTKEELDFCSNVGKLARTIMEKRQLSVSMSEMIEIAGDSKLILFIVEDAYEISRYNSETVVQNVVNDFENKYYQACYINAKEAAK